ncbi:MAG: hypothetical protein R3B72_39255 [Polyangiaceae bacterium]
MATTVGGFVFACGSTTEQPVGGGDAVGGDGGSGGEAGAGGAPSPPPPTGGDPRLPEQACADGSFATAIDADGMLACAPLEIDVPSAVEQGCSLYFGWRDGCSGCSAGPSKVGRVDGSSCANVAGGDDTCLDPAMLGSASLPLFGLNTDGDVDNNDMFYAGIHCPASGETGLVGPCEPGEHAVLVDTTGAIECMPTAAAVVAYVRAHCDIYLGWRDGCNGCPDPPSKWGRQRGISCEDGAGADNSCGVPFVDSQWVPLVGINTDGDVDDNDTFYLGLACDDLPSEEVVADQRCPFGTLLVGIDDQGRLRCVAPNDQIAPVVRNDCQLAFGYRDGCNGCTDPPSKWGLTSSTTCTPGVATTCATHVLGAASVELLAFRTDGDVDGNDKFYAGFTCR